MVQKINELQRNITKITPGCNTNKIKCLNLSEIEIPVIIFKSNVGKFLKHLFVLRQPKRKRLRLKICIFTYLPTFIMVRPLSDINLISIRYLLSFVLQNSN